MFCASAARRHDDASGCRAKTGAGGGGQLRELCLESHELIPADVRFMRDRIAHIHDDAFRRDGE
jgi:hypothetical protein